MTKQAFAVSLKATFPVMLGYVPLGMAFGLLAVNAGYPAWLPIVMSVFVFAGAAQFIAVGMFASGASVAEIALVTLVVNIRHAAYGFSLIKEFARFPRKRPYLVFALTDETYALLTSLPDDEKAEGDRLVGIAALDQLWWVLGTAVGALAGTLIPFKLRGLDFALTALFLVLAVEQALRVKKAKPFLAAGIATVAAAFAVGPRATIVVALLASVAALLVLEKLSPKRKDHSAPADTANGGEKK